MDLKKIILCGILFLMILFPTPDASCDCVSVTSSVRTSYSGITFNRSSNIMSGNLSVTNISAAQIPGPIVVSIESITENSVTVQNPDGFLESGVPYLVVSDSALEIGRSTPSRNLQFSNPNRLRFRYVLAVSSCFDAFPRSVVLPKANPSSVLVGESTMVTFTAHVSANPNIAEVDLIELDEAGSEIGCLGYPHDDGINGDALPGDGIFTWTGMIQRAAPDVIVLRYRVLYGTPPSPLESEDFNIDIVQLPSEEQVNEALMVNLEASTNFQQWLNEYGWEEAAQNLAEWLRNQEDVEDAAISEDGTVVWVTYGGGLESNLVTGPPGSLSYPKNNKAILMSPLYSEPLFAGDDECDHIFVKLDADSCVNPDPIVKDSQVTVDFLKSIYKYGVVSLYTHGTTTRDGKICLQTGERANFFLGIPTSHLIDWILGRVQITTNNYFMITPDFVTHYASGNYPNSLITISACHSMDNHSMADAFLNKGAGTYFGWRNPVSATFAKDIKNTLFDRMIDQDMTTGQAFGAWTEADRTLDGAVFLMKGDVDLKLPVDLISNGGFETGDLSGWTSGFQEGGDFPQYASAGGYAVIDGGNISEGSFAGRMGRWDQVYPGGLRGPASAGLEPSGIDYIYQDINLPAGGTYSINFKYNLQTYDTAIWDWFDAQIRDPNTNNVLATIVTRYGQPGYDYGVYWNGGWIEATYDLTPYAGQTIRVWFGDRQDGWGDQCAVWIDEVSIGCN